MAFNFRKKQVRPLQQLVSAMNQVAEGHAGAAINITTNAPFAELTHSFNRMLTNVNHKVTALETLSQLDHKIATHLDVDNITQRVIDRVETLVPEACVVVLTLQERTSSDQNNLNSTLTSNKAVNLSRFSLHQQELNAFKASSSGLFVEKDDETLWSFTRIFNCEAAYYWGYAIRFEGECLGLMVVKHLEPLRKINALWDEVRALSDRIGVAMLAQQRKDALLLQSQYDELTGLPNRILLQDRIKLAIDHSDFTGYPFWLLYLDLDRFKNINESLGHSAGDDMLTIMATRLSAILSDTDTMARFAGDEFVLLISSAVTDNQRMWLLKQLMEAIQQPYIINGEEITITGSIGIANYPNDGKTPEQLIKNAETAMYRAKEKGKNTFSFFKQAVNKRIIDRLQMEMQLRKAIENNELVLNYQPKVSLDSGQIVGMEALVVWHSEQFGIVPSQHFIPLAEETGLITAIGEWVLKNACAQAVAWKEKGYAGLLVSVNLSAKQFNQPNLCQSVLEILNTTGLPANCLELELTESIIMNKAQSAIAQLNEIKAIGVSLSIDDFGTGYSSLSYLQSLPIDTLKIDKSFTDAIIDEQSEAPIVASMISLAQNLHLKVVTEGVETTEQVNYLKAHDCDEIQGFVFSKPVDADQFQQLLASKTTL